MQFVHLKRREFITLLGGAVTTWPLAARAQQAEQVWQIGFLGLGTAPTWGPWIAALRVCLRDLGYVESINSPIADQLEVVR